MQRTHAASVPANGGVSHLLRTDELPRAFLLQTNVDFRWLDLNTSTREVVIRPYDGHFVPPKQATDAWLAANRERLRTALVLDTETTGLDWRRDSIIEIGLRAIQYVRSTGEIVRVIDAYDALQDPGVPLPAKVQQLTGLTDRDLAGQSIDVARVSALIASAQLIIAHNAAFDRPFIDAFLASRGPRHEATKSPAWACSIVQIDWESHGLPGTKLEMLCALHGFYSTAHRAGADADALVRLLSLRNRESGTTYLQQLLEFARAPWILVSADGSPIETKDLLKERRYTWSVTRRVWQRIIRGDQRTDEEAWLAATIYGGRSFASFREIRPTERFAATDP